MFTLNTEFTYNGIVTFMLMVYLNTQLINKRYPNATVLYYHIIMMIMRTNPHPFRSILIM